MANWTFALCTLWTSKEAALRLTTSCMKKKKKKSDKEYGIRFS